MTVRRVHVNTTIPKKGKPYRVYQQPDSTASTPRLKMGVISGSGIYLYKAGVHVFPPPRLETGVSIRGVNSSSSWPITRAGLAQRPRNRDQLCLSFTALSKMLTWNRAVCRRWWRAKGKVGRCVHRNAKYTERRSSQAFGIQHS